MASLTFKDSAGANVVSPTIKSIIYEDAAQNKYTFGVDNTIVFPKVNDKDIIRYLSYNGI